MLIALDRSIDKRLNVWSTVMKTSPEKFINDTLDKALEDWEDYEEALKICAEVDAGRMKVYSLAEVERHLDERNALEG